MIEAMAVIIAGIVAGFLIREKGKVLSVFEKVSSVTIYILLFFMGLSVGTNATVLNSFPKVGGIAIVLTFGALVGSVALTFAVDRIFFRKEK